MNADRYLTALPAWALLATAFLVAVMAPLPQAASADGPADRYLAERQAIVQAEVAREARGQDCVDPATLKPGQFPSRILVSTVNGSHPATAVESMTWAQAEREAKAGRVTVRCAVI